MLKNNRLKNNRLKNNKPRTAYARAKWLALGSIVVVAAVLNWAESLLT